MKRPEYPKFSENAYQDSIAAGFEGYAQEITLYADQCEAQLKGLKEVALSIFESCLGDRDRECGDFRDCLSCKEATVRKRIKAIEEEYE